MSESRCATGPNLAVRGSTPKPLSRTGSKCGALKTGSRPGSQMSPVDALAATLVTKMREKFGEAAKDVIAQELIAKECKSYILKNGSMQQDDLSSLEESIRVQLTGRTPLRKTMVLEHKARLRADEWARIWKFESARVQRETARDRDVNQERKEMQRTLLDEQVELKKRAAEEERQQDKQDGLAISADVKQWEEDEAARKAAALAKVMQFKAMRESQVREKEERLQRAREKIAAEEADMAARLAYEVKTEFEKEAAAKAAAKSALIEYLAGNEVNKKLKEEEKERQRQEDLAYMRQYEEILDQQQRARVERLEKLKAWQDKNESKAASMPESKRWIDPAIIQRNWEEKEAAQEAEEDRRRGAVKERNRRMVSALNKQVAERVVQKQLDKQVAEEHSKRYLAGAEAQKQRDLEERRQRVQMKINAKLELESQMRENARRRREAPMSDVEKLLNKSLLEHVDTYDHSNRLPLTSYPKEYLPTSLNDTEKQLTEQHSRRELKSARGLIKSAKSEL